MERGGDAGAEALTGRVSRAPARLKLCFHPCAPLSNLSVSPRADSSCLKLCLAAQHLPDANLTLFVNDK